MPDPGLALWLIGVAVLSAVFGMLLVATLVGGPPARTDSVFGDSGAATTMIFDGDTLVDASPSARSLLHHSPMSGGSGWSRFLSWASARFPDASGLRDRASGEGRVALQGTAMDGTPMLLTAELRGGLLHVAVGDAEGGDCALRTDAFTHRATQEELETLRQCAATAPLPIWRESDSGDVVWCNRSYLDLAAARTGAEESLTWPLPRLFERLASAQGAADQRQRVVTQNEVSFWFDLWSFPDAAGRLCFAMPADGAVQAELALRDFMQTLTKTFAHLATGLAIFDRNRQLAMFNPALIDLTGLPPEFLTTRPTMVAMFDAMRERSMLPEPRDYRSWRRALNDLEQAASAGLYEETWSLPGGQTYRVTGRPHPNGALALLVEDISDEMSQTRRYRADLELSQAVIDAMDEGIAVFSAAGVLVQSNAAYVALWGHDPDATLGGTVGVAQACDHWRSHSAPTLLWDRVEDFVTAITPPGDWTDTVRLADGRKVTCRFVSLPGGARLAGFRCTETARPAASAPRLRKSA
jgi:PAS domain-containing protein